MLKTVEIYDSMSSEEFINIIEKHFSKAKFYIKLLMKSANDMPVKIKNLDIGPCLEKWNVTYLNEKLSDKDVRVHVSYEKKLNFIEKNFHYATMKFSHFLTEASDVNNKKSFYLRSHGNDKRGKEVSNLDQHFPEIASDFVFPEFIADLFNKSIPLFFSSVLRIASPNLNLWTHYDVMDNILINIVGTKLVTLFSPKDIKNLYIEGDKSRIIDIFASDCELNSKFPLFKNCTRYECILEKGEGLFIPSFWFHNVLSKNFTIGVNIFWKNQELAEKALYDINDSYGNKELKTGQKALKDIEKVIKNLSELPE